jgi:hypothetical protein
MCRDVSFAAMAVRQVRRELAELLLLRLQLLDLLSQGFDRLLVPCETIILLRKTSQAFANQCVAGF